MIKLLIFFGISAFLQLTLSTRLQVTTHTITLPNSIAKDPDYIYRYCDQGQSQDPLPIYAQSLPTNQLVVAYTDTLQTVHVLTVSNDFQTVLSNRGIPGKDCRGLYAFPNGTVSLLVRRGSCVGKCPYCGPPGPCPPADQMWFVVSNQPNTITVNQQIDNRIYDFSLGAGRLMYGFLLSYNKSFYEAYYKVHSISTMCAPIQPGHEGDTLKVFTVPPPFNASAPVNSPSWCWGCSHSMDIRIAINTYIQDIASVCVSDEYPYQGLIFNGQKLIYKFPGYGNGATTGGLGSFIADVVSPYLDGYIVLWNAPKPGADYYQNTTELAIARVDRYGGLRGSIVWLSNTPTLFEEAGHLVPFGGTGSATLLLAWWTIPKSSVKCNSCCVQPSVTGSITAPRTRYVALLNAVDFSFQTLAQDVTQLVNFDERNDFFTLNSVLPGNPGAGFVATWNRDPKTCLPSQTYSSPSNNISIVTFTITNSDVEDQISFPCAPNCISLSGSVVPLPFPPTSANGVYTQLAVWNGTRPAYVLQGSGSRYIYFDPVNNGGQWLYDSDLNPSGYLGTTFGSSALIPTDIPKGSWYIYNGSQFVLDPNIVITSC